MNKEDIEELKREIKALKQANIEYKNRIDKALEDIKEYKEMNYSIYYENEIEIELIDKIIEILKGEDNE